MNDEQFRLACEKELKYIVKQERKLQKQAMNSDKSWKNAIESLIPEKIYINLRQQRQTSLRMQRNHWRNCSRNIRSHPCRSQVCRNRALACVHAEPNKSSSQDSGGYTNCAPPRYLMEFKEMK